MTISNNILSVVVSILKAKTGKFAVKFFFRLNSHWGLIRSKSSEEPNTWISRDLNVAVREEKPHIFTNDGVARLLYVSKDLRETFFLFTVKRYHNRADVPC